MVKKIKGEKKEKKEIKEIKNENKEKTKKTDDKDEDKKKNKNKNKNNVSMLHKNIKEKRINIKKDKKENKKLKNKKIDNKEEEDDEKEEEEQGEEGEEYDEKMEEEDSELEKIIKGEEEDSDEDDDQEENEGEEKEEESNDDDKEEDEKDEEEKEDNSDEGENKEKNKKEKKEKKKAKKEEKEEKEKKDVKLLNNAIVAHYYTFQTQKDLFTLLYTSLIFKWIDTTKILIICNTPKEGYKIDIFLREFRFNSIYLDKEMPLNTNTHFCNQYLKNNYQICVINIEYSEKSKNYGKEILDNTKVPITIIYFDCYSVELLEYHSFHPNTRSIYHFISNKDSFLDNYENLNENIQFNEFVFDREQMEHLRYRAEDIVNGIRKSDIKKEKMRKINIELLHSKNMEKFFKDNPKEKENVIKTIQENTIQSYAPSVSFLPSYLIHNENNVIANAIKKQYKDKPRHNNNRRRNKKKKMEQYFEALDKGDGSQNLIKF